MKIGRAGRKPREERSKEGNMKRLFRRNQIIITTLAIMIAAAGYLNYAGNHQIGETLEDTAFQVGSPEISDEDIFMENQAAGIETEGATEMAAAENEAAGETEPVSMAEIESWDHEEAGLENPGEAVLTSGMTVSDYIANVQLGREQIRAKNRETLNSIINNVNIEEAAKQEAIQSMIRMTAVAEKENAAETLLQAKGFVNPVVSLTEQTVDVVIQAASITDQQRAQIEDIVKRKTQIEADGIVITLLKTEEQTENP